MDKSVFLCVRLLDDKSHIIPGTKAFGNVDLRKSEGELLLEIKAINESLDLNNLKYDSKLCPRLVTLVEAKDEFEAFINSSLIIEEMLDLFDSNYSFGLKRSNLLTAGYIYNLSNNQIFSLSPDYFISNRSDSIPQGPVVHLIKDLFEPLDRIQAIFNLPSNDVVDRIFRASYWIRLAKYENNDQLKIIFFWFSLETLCKTQIEEDIVPKILLCMGFINSYKNLLINRENVQRFINNPDYKIWKKTIQKYLEEIRNYRNNSVHDGYRIKDFETKKSKVYLEILSMASNRIVNYFINGALYSFQDSKELWEYMPLFVESNPNVYNDLFGTVIYSIKNPI